MHVEKGITSFVVQIVDESEDYYAASGDKFAVFMPGGTIKPGCAVGEEPDDIKEVVVRYAPVCWRLPESLFTGAEDRTEHPARHGAAAVNTAGERGYDGLTLKRHGTGWVRCSVVWLGTVSAITRPWRIGNGRAFGDVPHRIHSQRVR